jgi:hypothetical protein
MEKLEKIEAESSDRVAKAGDQHGEGLRHSAVVLMLFEADGVPEQDPAREQGNGKHLGRRSSRRPQPLRAAASADLE